MRFNKVRKLDIANGPGVRVSLFVQGCSLHCEGCFNPSTWDFSAGKPFTKEIEDEILEMLSLSHIDGLSILGGDPLHPDTIEDSLAFIQRVKEAYPNKTIWVWTGYTLESFKDWSIFKNIDVLVDGPFVIEKHNPSLRFRGSENQRIINIKETLHFQKICIFEE